MGLSQFWERFFFRHKLARVHASSAAPKFHGMLQMQHLVKHDVFDDEARHAGMIKDTADHDRVVRGIVVAEAIPGMVAAPGELWTAHQAMEEPAVQVFEN